MSATEPPCVAPWLDYIGQPIHKGDRIVHPADGAEGTVLFWPERQDDSDRWRVAYGDGTISRLILQIGGRGRAVVKDAAR